MLKFLVIVLLLALAIYAVARVIERRGVRPAPRRSRPEPPRFVGPDDDPDFLRDLERKRRHRDEPDTT